MQDFLPLTTMATVLVLRRLPCFFICKIVRAGGGSSRKLVWRAWLQLCLSADCWPPSEERYRARHPARWPPSKIVRRLRQTRSIICRSVRFGQLDGCGSNWRSRQTVWADTWTRPGPTLAPTVAGWAERENLGSVVLIS